MAHEPDRMCDGCLTLKPASAFAVGMPYCIDCSRPAQIDKHGERIERREATREEETMFEKRSCAKGCGKLLDPRGAHKHEAHCTGQAAAPKKPRRKNTVGAGLNPAPTALAIRRAHSAVPDVRRAPSAATRVRAAVREMQADDLLRAQIATLIADGEAALRTLDRLALVQP